MGRKILRSGRIGFRLALFGIVMRVVVNLGSVRVGNFAFGGMFFYSAGLNVMRERFGMQFLVMFFVVMQRLVRIVVNFFVVSFVGVLFIMMLVR